ncbi:MAG: HAD family phosphatase [Rhodothermaceae bacterium]|nr:HAD family phosphatase [Rhodothermaceae bacterium]
MITLFFTDIDGCLSEPYQPFDLEGFAQLRAWAARAEAEPTWPRIGVCSGRSYAYAEAIAQALDLKAPVLFESGGGWFDLPSARIRWNPALTPAVEHELNAVRAFCLASIFPQDERFSLDYGKRAQAGIVHPIPYVVEQVLPVVREFVTAQFPDLHVYHTPVSIDVVPSALTKRRALEWVAEASGLTLRNLAFIGDTTGDVEAIEGVGLGFAPKNAEDVAREAADLVTDGATLRGVLEAYRRCVQHNEQQAATS